MNLIRFQCVFAFLLVSFALWSQENILDMRENYDIGQTVTVSGVVTSDHNLGTVRYLQDATAGIAIYPGVDWSDWEATPEIGDSLSVTGVITEYNGLLEVGPDLTVVDFFSPVLIVPEPLEITPAQMGENLEGQLVRINGVTFPLAGIGINGNSTYEFNASGETGVFYVQLSNTLVDEQLSDCEVDMFGIVSQYTFDGTGGYQLLPRGPADLVPVSAVCPAENPCGIEGLVVEASNFEYAPSAVEIELGQTVVWVNVGGTHDVNGLASSITGEPYNNPEAFNISPVTGNSDGVCLGSHTFTVGGTHDYDCSIGNHAANGMVATVTVNPAEVSNSVFDIIVNSTAHTILEAALLETGLAGTLSGEGSFTLFAPTDDAFNLLPAGAVEELFSNIPLLNDILLHHIVGDLVMSSFLSNGQTITTLLGDDLTVDINSSGVFIDNAMVTVVDIVADNGVLHGIDAVLIPELTGCTETSACNFEPDALLEDNALCVFPGCQDSNALNFDSEAGCAGECIYLTYDCLSIGDEAWSDVSVGLYPAMQQAMHGVSWSGEWVFNVPASLIEPGSGVTYAVHHVEWSSVDGLPAWVENVDYSLGELSASSQHCIAAEGTPSEPLMHTVSASGEAFISIFGQPFSIGEQTYSATISVLENPDPILGCTYGNAVNYLAYANTDDGTCSYPGCMDSTAGNYNPYATEDDGSCGEICNDDDVESSCTTDVNDDGAVNVSDLLILLSEFGISCE